MTLSFFSPGINTPSTPASSTVSTMPPNPIPAPSFDYGPLIRANCRIFLGPETRIEVSTQLDGDGQWNANATMLKDGQRTKVLGSGSAESLARALEQLHEKSARAANNYIKDNGFDVPRKVTWRSARASRSEVRRSDGAMSEDLENSEVLALSDSTSDEESDSDEDSTQGHNGRIGARHSRKPARVSFKGMALPPKASGAAPNLGFFADKNMPHRPLRRPPVPARMAMPIPTAASIPAPIPTSIPVPRPAPAPGLPPIPARDTRFSMPPPPPPPGWHSPPIPLPLPTQFPTPPPPLQTFNPAQKGAISMWLNIRWIHHGERKFLVVCVPTESALTQRALSLVHGGATTFANVKPTDITPASLCSLRAVVRQVTLGDNKCEVANYGDDYSTLCSTYTGVVGFDIDVDN